MTSEDYILNHLPVEPDDYFRGISCDDPNLPGELLMFLRNKGRQVELEDPMIHHRFNLIVNLSGEGIISLDSQDIELASGHALLIFPYQLQYYKKIDLPLAWAYTSFHLDDYSSLEAFRYKPVSVSARAMQSYRYALEHYRLHMKGEGKTDPSLVGLYHLVMFREMALQLPSQPYEATPFKSDGERNSFIRKLESEIWRQGYSCSVQTLAEAMLLSESALHKKCGRILGTSPGRLISDLRLDQAQKLLSRSSLSIAQVSLACRFATAGSFSRAFKSRFGMTPREYRKK